MKDTLRLQKKGFQVGVIEMIGLLVVDALNEGSIGWFDITDLLYEKTGITIDLTDDDIRGKVRTE